VRVATAKAPMPQSLGINQPLPADALAGISEKCCSANVVPDTTRFAKGNSANGTATLHHASNS